MLSEFCSVLNAFTKFVHVVLVVQLQLLIELEWSGKYFAAFKFIELVLEVLLIDKHLSQVLLEESNLRANTSLFTLVASNFLFSQSHFLFQLLDRRVH